MAEVLEFFSDKMGIVIGVLFGLLTALAVIRSVRHRTSQKRI